MVKKYSLYTYKQYRQAIRCDSNGLLIIPISLTCFGR